ncbi:MAG: endolytic transglycosylase MltG [Actinomycetota bacterium]
MSLLENDDRYGDYDDGYYDDEYLPWEDEDDFVRVRNGGLRVIIGVIALIFLIAIGWFVYSGARSWFESQLDPEGVPGEQVTVFISAGSTTSDISETLEAQGVVPNSTFFRYYADYKGEGNFQAGEYTMQLNSSAAEAIEVLNAGPIPPVYERFGVPEGLWVSEMLPRIAADLPNISAADLQAVLDNNQIEPRYRPDGVTSWEGLLFPAFYEIEDDAEAVDVLAQMNNKFAEVTGRLGYGAAETTLNLSAYEVIIVASMVEAEAKQDEDRGKIARVIYNRLREQQSLDIDATCIYGSGQRGYELTRDVLDNYGDYFDPGYACRVNASLPPTPIAAPGEASLAAAINPTPNPLDAEGNEIAWLYYVLKDAEGYHLFTDDYDEFINQKNLSIEQGLF